MDPKSQKVTGRCFARAPPRSGGSDGTESCLRLAWLGPKNEGKHVLEVECDCVNCVSVFETRRAFRKAADDAMALGERR